MKATLEFDLEDRYDRMAHLRCVKSLDLALDIFNVKEEISRLYKREEITEHVFDSLHSVLEVALEELIE